MNVKEGTCLLILRIRAPIRKCTEPDAEGPVLLACPGNDCLFPRGHCGSSFRCIAILIGQPSAWFPSFRTLWLYFTKEIFSSGFLKEPLRFSISLNHAPMRPLWDRCEPMSCFRPHQMCINCRMTIDGFLWRIPGSFLTVLGCCYGYTSMPENALRQLIGFQFFHPRLVDLITSSYIYRWSDDHINFVCLIAWSVLICITPSCPRLDGTRILRKGDTSHQPDQSQPASECMRTINDIMKLKGQHWKWRERENKIKCDVWTTEKHTLISFVKGTTRDELKRIVRKWLEIIPCHFSLIGRTS